MKIKQVKRAAALAAALTALATLPASGKTPATKLSAKRSGNSVIAATVAVDGFAEGTELKIDDGKNAASFKVRFDSGKKSESKKTEKNETKTVAVKRSYKKGGNSWQARTTTKNGVKTSGKGSASLAGTKFVKSISVTWKASSGKSVFSVKVVLKESKKNVSLTARTLKGGKAGKWSGKVALKAPTEKKKSSAQTPVKPRLLTESKTMKEGDVFTLSPVGFSPKNAKWVSSSPKTASVNGSGKVRALKSGSAVITASYGGQEFKCEVAVVGNGATKGKVVQEAKAYGINGGVALTFRSVKGAKKYVVLAKDRAGKIRSVTIPENKKGQGAGEYDKFRKSSGSMNCWYVRKLGHNYESINSWMNKNNSTYGFKIYAKDKKGRTLAVSEWLWATPFNVEKDAPEQDVMLPDKYVTKDPEDPKGKSHGPNAQGNEIVKTADDKKFEIVRIDEQDGKASISWKNRVRNFVPSSFLVEWGPNSDGAAKSSKSVDLAPNRTGFAITGLKNEREYVVSVTAKGTIGKRTVWMKAEEIVVPHTKATRKAKLSRVRLGDPYFGEAAPSEKLTKSEAEAFANYGNGGKAFSSRTKYLIWTNLRQIRTYIFTKTKTKEWRLWKNLPCGIGRPTARTNPGVYTLRTKDWIFAWPDGNKKAGTVSPYGWNLNSSSMRTVQFLVYYDSYYGNALHTPTYQTMEDKLTSGKFSTAGCVQLDRPWEKWIYDFGIGSTLVIR